MTVTKAQQTARGSTNHAGGRPRRYETPEEMQAKVDEYFTEENMPWTMCGLALFLGFVERNSLWHGYGGRPEFRPVLKRARLLIEEQYERRLVCGKGQVAGPISALKQLGWTDKNTLTLDMGDEVRDLLRWVQDRNKKLPKR